MTRRCPLLLFLTLLFACRTQDKREQETKHLAVFAKRLLPFSELLLQKSQA